MGTQDATADETRGRSIQQEEQVAIPRKRERIEFQQQRRTGPSEPASEQSCVRHLTVTKLTKAAGSMGCGVNHRALKRLINAYRGYGGLRTHAIP